MNDEPALRGGENVHEMDAYAHSACAEAIHLAAQCQTFLAEGFTKIVLDYRLAL
jgi:hypothetical protein